MSERWHYNPYYTATSCRLTTRNHPELHYCGKEVWSFADGMLVTLNVNDDEPPYSEFIQINILMMILIMRTIITIVIVMR